MKIAITGHRPNKLGNDYNLTSELVLNIKKKILEILHGEEIMDISNKVTLITGMALGIDTLFAKIAIEYNIPFIAAIPCAGQASMWTASSKKLYFDIVEHPLCTKHWCSTEPYGPRLMQQRNEWMVDNSDILIAVWDGSKGGTKNCIEYAYKQTGAIGTERKSTITQIIRIDPKDL